MNFEHKRGVPMTAKTKQSLRKRHEPTSNGNGLSHGLEANHKFVEAIGAPNNPIDPFPFGWRIVERRLPNGEIDIDHIPLSEEDILDPQLGDVMPQSDPHLKLAVSIYNRFDKRYQNDPTTGVFCDLKIIWGIPGLSGPAPDLAVVPNLTRDKHANRGSFAVIEEGTRPTLVLEIVSPQYPGDDTRKPEIYEQAGVPEYIILDPHLENTRLNYELIGFKLVQGQYVRMIADAQGRLLSEATGVYFGLGKSQRELILTDAISGERLLTDQEEYVARMKAEQHAVQSSHRAQQESERAERETQRAERETQRANEEHQARLAAEAEIARLRALLQKNNLK